jgi:hypothetical protein
MAAIWLEAKILVEKILGEAEVPIEAEGLARVDQQAIHCCNKALVKWCAKT